MHFHLNSFHRFFFTCITLFLLPIVCLAVNVKDFGAKGDGEADDTRAINAAIAGAVDGVVEFPRGHYRITQTIDIDLSVKGTLGLSGMGGSARIIMESEGPAVRFTGSHDRGSAQSSTVKSITWEKERMPLIEGLEIVGAHKNADGIELINTMQPVLRALLIREVRNGIYLTSRNRNVLIVGCHVYNLSGIGIFLDQVNIHQMIISASHISYCKKGGIKVVNSQIRNFQIVGNDIEYNFDPEEPASADVWIDCSQGGVVREGTIVGNTIQALPSTGGVNVRFTGPSGSSNKTGLWSISGNHISSQEINILLENSRGINITGNNLLRGYDRHIVINDSRNVVVSSNVIDHNDDYFIKSVAEGGISVNRGRNIILSDNIIDGAEYGNAQQGGALVVTDSREISVDGCHIINPKFNGIQIDHSANVRITNCIISEDAKSGRMLSAIAVKGACPGTVIRDNSVGKGTKGGIWNQATGVVVEANTALEAAVNNK